MTNLPEMIWSQGVNHAKDNETDHHTGASLCDDTTIATAPARDAVSEWVQHPAPDTGPVPAKDQEGQQGLAYQCPCRTDSERCPLQRQGELDVEDYPGLALQQNFVYLTRFDVCVRDPALEPSPGQGLTSFR